MGILTFIFFSLLAVFIRAVVKRGDEKQQNQSMQLMKSIGLLGLVVGVLGQLIGLFSAFSFIENAGDVSLSVLAGGLKVSLITTLYGLIIYIAHLVLSMVLKRIVQ